MFRSLITIIFILLFFIVSIPILLIELLVKKFSQEAYEYSQLRIVQWAFRVVQFLSGVKLTMIGFENIPKDEPVLFVGNHQSIYDVVVTYGHVPNMTAFISKDSMKKVPIIATYMKRIHCLFLERDNLRDGLRVINAAIDLIKQGVSVVVYPEGHRNQSGDCMKVAEFKNGSFKIAQRTGCTIIPMAAVNTPNIFEAHVPWLKKTHVVLEFGKPVKYDDLTPEQKKNIGEHFRGIILDMLEKDKALV